MLVLADSQLFSTDSQLIENYRNNLKVTVSQTISLKFYAIYFFENTNFKLFFLEIYRNLPKLTLTRTLI